MQPKKQAQVVVILGQRGSGKTTLLNRKLLGVTRLLLVLPRVDPAFRGFRYVSTLADATRATAERKFRVAWILDPADQLRWEGLCRLVYERGDMVLATDELHEYCPNVHATIGKYFKRLCLHGRHVGVSLYGISQRPANLHKDFLSQAGTIYVFRLSFPGDIKALRGSVPGVERCVDFKVGEHLTFP